MILKINKSLNICYTSKSQVIYIVMYTSDNFPTIYNFMLYIFRYSVHTLLTIILKIFAERH